MAASRAQGQRSLVSDIEKQSEKQDEAGNHKDPHSVALQVLFGLNSERMGQLRILSSVTCWCRYVEESFQPLLTERYATIWTSLGLQQPKIAAQCWNLFHAVAGVIAELGDTEHSIEDLREFIKPQADPITAQQTSATAFDGGDYNSLVAIFAVLCWSSMILRPELEWTMAAFTPCLAVQQPLTGPRSLKIDFVQRPIPVVFRNFQKALAQQRPPRTPAKDINTTLFVSTINGHSLQTIGKVSFRWVEDLSSHLDLDTRSRTLSIFRFPSFCACAATGGDRNVLFDELVRVSFLSSDANPLENEWTTAQLSQEVLMSYRLLFGQSRRARKVGKSLLQKTKSTGHYDRLLEQLCAESQSNINRRLPGSFWPGSCCDFDGKLQEAAAYNMQDDFPILGRRLAIIQEFSLRQQPSRLRDLWRDRRNPLQWYTFWAVLIFGGISNIVAILQLAVAILQILAPR